MDCVRAPIALFVYARLDHTRKTVEALKRNLLAGESELVVFSDWAKEPTSVAQVEAVRSYIRTVTGFKSISIIERERNLGLAQSIISGVSSVCETHDRVIVVEDDLVTSPFFLSFMNDALDQYANTPEVGAISGFHPPFDRPVPETFFQRDAECWGWATWKRAWIKFDPNGRELLSELKRRRMLKMFDQNGTYPYVRMLEDQIAGRNDSWAIRWRASVILNGMMSLYPGRSLVRNIGLDGSGTHGDFWNMVGEVADGPVCVDEIPIVHSNEGFKAFIKFNRRFRWKNRVARLIRRLQKLNPRLQSSGLSARDIRRTGCGS
jgi:hypothetical protein